MFGNHKFNIGVLKHPGFNKGKGGGGGGGNTTATTYTTNIPEYAKPYVNTMLGTAQQQIYDMDDEGNVTGFRPYVPYSENPQDFVAPFSPLQMQSYYGAGEMQVPGQYETGSNLATMSGLGSMGIAGQAANAGQNYYGMATNPYAAQAFMSPYVSASLAPQLAEMERQYGISGTQQQSNATRAGAFGGSREALMAAENQRNKNMAMNQAIGQGYDKAFQAAQQAQQFGAGLGLQGQQAALTGLGQVGQAGATLGNLGTAQLGAQQGILNTQNLYGQQLQQQQQNIINQAIQTYANQQQYPMQQLGNMSNLLRGLPMQSSSTQSYQAPPSPLATAAGLGTGIAGIASLMKAEGGIVKGYAGGGITSLENRQRIAEDLNPQQLQTSIQNKTIPMQVGQMILQDNANMQQGMGIEGANSNITPTFAEGGIIAFAEGDLIDAPEMPFEVRGYDTKYAQEMLDASKNPATGKRYTEEEISSKRRAKEENLGIKDIYAGEMERLKGEEAKLGGKEDRLLGLSLLGASGKIFENANKPGLGWAGAGIGGFAESYGPGMEKLDALKENYAKQQYAAQAAQQQLRQAQMTGDESAYKAATGDYNTALTNMANIDNKTTEEINKASLKASEKQYEYATETDKAKIAASATGRAAANTDLKWMANAQYDKLISEGNPEGPKTRAMANEQAANILGKVQAGDKNALDILNADINLAKYKQDAIQAAKNQPKSPLNTAALAILTANGTKDPVKIKAANDAYKEEEKRVTDLALSQLGNVGKPGAKPPATPAATVQSAAGAQKANTAPLKAQKIVNGKAVIITSVDGGTTWKDANGKVVQ